MRKAIRRKNYFYSSWKSTKIKITLIFSSKVALCIEGGGMRGCVNAGALAAMQYLGLDDSVDIVYGSSAGSLMGAYFISKQDKDHVFYSGIFILNLVHSCLPKIWVFI